MAKVIKILIVEDDKILSDSIKNVISELGTVSQAFNGEDGLYEAEQGIYDLLILDIMLPLLNGYDVLSQLRQKKVEVPVLILTAKDGLDDKIEGFQKGADDYLTKPFHREELLVRVKALLKRSLGLFAENILKLAELECHLGNRTVTYKGEELYLQGKEFDILTYLIQNKNMIVTKEQIFDRIWGFDSETSLTVVEVYMSNLRKNLKKVGLDRLIRTLRNVGYMLETAT